MPVDFDNVIDAIVVGGYLVLSFGFGLFASKLLKTEGAEGEEGYYLAGRKVPGWMNGISYAVTAMNADVAPTYAGFAVVVGLPIAWFYLPRFALAWMLAAMLFAVRWRQLGVRTGPEFYKLRFGGQTSRFIRVYSALFAVAVNMVPWIGAGMLGVHKIFWPIFGDWLGPTLGPLFGVDDIGVTLLVILPVLVLYVWVSGFAGVLVTDVIQSLIILAANLSLLVMVLWDFGGPAALADAVREARPEEAGEILGAWPAPGHRVLGPMVAFAWLVMGTIGRGGSVDLEGQRIFSCRSARDAAKVGVWGAASLFAMLVVVTVPTLGLIAKQPEMYLAEAGVRETAYSLLLDEYLPVGLLGAALAALLASVMSTIDSHLNYGAQTLVNDVLRQLLPNVSWLDEKDSRCVWVGRLLMLVIMAGGVVVAYNSESLIGIAVTLGGLFGSVATLYWGQWWWWRVNFWSWLAAMAGGPAVFFGLRKVLPELEWWQTQAEMSGAAAETMGALLALISIVLTTALWVTVTVFTAPERMETLKAFYVKAKPMGWWGPVRRALEEDGRTEELPPEGLLLGGTAVACVGAAWLSAAVLAAYQAAGGAYGNALLLGGAAVALGLAFKRGFDWHIGRMAPEDAS